MTSFNKKWVLVVGLGVLVSLNSYAECKSGLVQQPYKLTFKWSHGREQSLGPDDTVKYGPICKGATLQIKLPKKWSYESLNFTFKKGEGSQSSIKVKFEFNGLGGFKGGYIARNGCYVDDNGLVTYDGGGECSIKIEGPINTGNIGKNFAIADEQPFNYIQISNGGDGEMSLDFAALGLRDSGNGGHVSAATN